jgi:hypothetical protein
MSEQAQTPFSYNFTGNDDHVIVFLVNDYTSRWAQISKSKDRENNYLLVVSYGNLSESGRPGVCKMPMIYMLDNGGATAHANDELQNKISRGYAYSKVTVNGKILYPLQQ